MDKTEFPSKPYHSRGGATVPHFKNTAGSESVSIPLPAEIVLPVQQHIGAPCVPCVNAGDRVFAAERNGFFDPSGNARAVGEFVKPLFVHYRRRLVEHPDPDAAQPKLRAADGKYAVKRLRHHFFASDRDFLN